MITPTMGIMRSFMAKLQSKNLEGFKFVDEAMRSGGNPQVLLQQMLGNASPEQRKNLIAQAKQFGCPDEILNQIQNMK